MKYFILCLNNENDEGYNIRYNVPINKIKNDSGYVRDFEIATTSIILQTKIP